MKAKQMLLFKSKSKEVHHIFVQKYGKIFRDSVGFLKKIKGRLEKSGQIVLNHGLWIWRGFSVYYRGFKKNVLIFFDSTWGGGGKIFEIFKDF